jgi:iron complex transport system ATP-binding protein
MIEIRDLNYSTGGNRILGSVFCVFETGSITGVIGANGSGKSTLLKHIYRELRSRNAIFFDGASIDSVSNRKFARKMAVLPQEIMSVPADFSVHEIVVMGRYPYKKLRESYDERDAELVGGALRFVELDGMEERRFSKLSGGEKQRVLLARALCQDTTILVLDEPVNHLDLKHQMGLMEILVERKKTAIIALHNLDLAAMYCDGLILLDKGQVVTHGTPREVLTEQNIMKYFGVNVIVISDIDGRPLIRPIRKRGSFR